MWILLSIFFDQLTEKELHETPDALRSKYIKIIYKNDIFDSNALSGTIKIFVMVIVIYSIRNTHYHQQKNLVL